MMGRCAVCGRVPEDYYMVTHSVWAEAGFAWKDHACILCLENRLRRPLEPEDFTDCPLNRGEWVQLTERHLDRLGRARPGEPKNERR